jgi:hypothetical protein
MKMHKSFFEELTASGGRVEYLIGLHHVGNVGFELDPDVIKELSVLGIWLAFDIYAFDASPEVAPK